MRIAGRAHQKARKCTSRVINVSVVRPEAPIAFVHSLLKKMRKVLAECVLHLSQRGKRRLNVYCSVRYVFSVSRRTKALHGIAFRSSQVLKADSHCGPHCIFTHPPLPCLYMPGTSASSWQSLDSYRPASGTDLSMHSIALTSNISCTPCRKRCVRFWLSVCCTCRSVGSAD